MDAHHDQVQKARAQARGGAARLYFAYSTVLDRSAFDEWRTQHGYEFTLPEGKLAVAPDLGLTFDFPSRWWGGRVAGLAASPGQAVHGRVFTIAAEDWPIVAHKEGAVTGMCVEREVTVLVEGSLVAATAFTTAPLRQSTEGPISQRFLEALRRGAQEAGLPAAYLAQLGQL